MVSRLSLSVRLSLPEGATLDEQASVCLQLTARDLLAVVSLPIQVLAAGSAVAVSEVQEDGAVSCRQVNPYTQREETEGMMHVTETGTERLGLPLLCGECLLYSLFLGVCDVRHQFDCGLTLPVVNWTLPWVRQLLVLQVTIQGLPHPVLLRESPGQLGIGGKVTGTNRRTR